MTDPNSDSELHRQKVLAEYGILDSEPERVFDDLVRLVSDAFQLPMASLSFIDADRQWFMATIGMEIKETTRADAFCDRTIAKGKTLVINDAARDPEFIDNPLVKDTPGIRFYAGAPLTTPDGSFIGSLAVMDRKPGDFTPDQIKVLESLARLAMEWLEERRRRLQLENSLITENQLRSSELRFRRLIDNIPDVVVLYSPDLTIRYINPATTRITGMQPEEFIGKRDSEIFPGPEHRPVLELLESARETRQFQSIETELTLPTRDEPRYLRISCVPLIGDDGEVFELIGITQDLTHQERTDRQLRENRRLSEIAGQIAHLGGWRVNLNASTVSWTQEVARIHGLPADFQPSFDEAIEYYVPEHRDLIQEVFKNCIEKGIPFDEELQIVNQESGQRVWIRTTGEVVRDQEGTIIGVQGAFQDISDRRMAEERILASEERFRLVTRVTSDVIWDLDCVNQKLWCSEGLKTTFGHDPNKLEITLEWWKGQMHPDEREALSRGFREALEGEDEQWKSRYRFQRADGTYARVSDETLIMRDDEGRAIRAIGSVRDLTQEVVLEEQVARAQRLDSIGQLTGGIAHDFNNLLTVILGNAELMSEMLDDQQPARQLAEMVQTAAQRGSELTNRLLAFARRQALDPEPTDIPHLVNEMQPLLRRSLTADIKLQIRHADNLWSAEIDPVQLESALLNLVINARDAMPSGGGLQINTANVTLKPGDVDAMAELAPGDYVEITVTDTGTGIKPEHMDMVFQPFFTTKPKGKGTGLGLPMVWGFIKQSRGHVQIDSDPGCGTTVRMYLPRALSSASLQHVPPAGRSTPADHARILVVEDDELVLSHARRLLDTLGYEVECAEDGDTALSLLRKDPNFDLLFTDIIMPGSLNGPALARKARELIPGIKILFTSGYTEDAVSHNELLDSRARLLHKPYRRQDLADKVSEALGQFES